jgi:hypothetical protein
VGAIIEPALEQAMRVSVVATGIDQSANRCISPRRQLTKKRPRAPASCSGCAYWQTSIIKLTRFDNFSTKVAAPSGGFILAKPALARYKTSPLCEAGCGCPEG